MALVHLRWFFVAGAMLPGFGLGGCTSNQDDVCENVGACSQAGSSDWIASCKEEAASLEREARSAGCGGFFDDYYECAADHFACHGITASFPGCDAKRAALETCLDAAEAKTSCKELTAKTSACAASPAGGFPGSSAVDAGRADTDTTGLVPACTVLRDCEARCYLDHVKNPCAPAVDELSGVAACSNRCPP
jgi:hypothetical protein